KNWAICSNDTPTGAASASPARRKKSWQVRAFLFLEAPEARTDEGTMVYPSRCPTREDLSAYLLGRLQDQQLDAVADHVDGCGGGGGARAPGGAGRDWRGRNLRGGPAPAAGPGPGLRRLRGRAKPLTPPPAVAEPPLPKPAAGGNQPATPAQLGQYRLLE